MEKYTTPKGETHLSSTFMRSGILGTTVALGTTAHLAETELPTSVPGALHL